MNLIMISEKNEEDQPTVVHKVKRTAKSNPNIQCTKNLEKKKKFENEELSSSDEDFRVTYKSNKSAMPAGPSDQGATATVVCIFILMCYIF